MAKLLDIRIYGDEILRKKLKKADPKDPFLKKYIPDLIYTMYMRDGVGLASNQVGVDLQIVAIDPWWGREEGKKEPRILINPEILFREGEQVGEEGCISLPGIFANVHRALMIRYAYTDLMGKRIEAETEGYEAVVIQHELDHLQGVVFTDHLSTLSKLRVKRKLNDLEARAENGLNIAIEEDFAR